MIPINPKLTSRHETAVFHLSVGQSITDSLFHALEASGLARVTNGERGLTERGCDMAAGRLTIKRGQIVKA